MDAASSSTNDALNDPPPPYPANSRTRRVLRTVRHSSPRTSCEDDHDTFGRMQQPIAVYTSDDEYSESTPFLTHSPQLHVLRPRSLSNSSQLSAAPSLAQTLASLFRDDFEVEGDIQLPSDENAQRRTFGSRWHAYWRPVRRIAYWKSLFHLAILNFPYALASWVYLFVFTVTGTSLLIALPIGVILCVANLFGARLFARGELSLQTKFHYPFVYPRHPLFTRVREPTEAELENGSAAPGQLVREQSFYKNTYAMMTDSLSYQALFYFLVVKPSITLIIFLLLIIVGIPLFALVLPIPFVLRVVRKVGVWQAGVAVEGLAQPVR